MKQTNFKQAGKLGPLVLFLLLAFCFNLNGQELSIHISPSGDNTHEGTEDKPVATMSRAKHLVRKLKSQQLDGDTIRVFFHEGVYRIKHGMTLNANESGTEKRPVIFQNYKADKVVITGSIPVEHFKRLSHDHVLYKKDPVIGRQIIEIDLTKTGIAEFNKMRLAGFRGNEKPIPYSLSELYFNGQPMPLSRWPNTAYSEFTHTVTDSSEVPERTGIAYQDAHISSWMGEPNMLLHGYWKYLWADAYEQVSHIDTLQKVIWLTPPYNHYNFGSNKPFAAYNVISEIDQPGEWAYDYQTKKIYFYPPEDASKTSMELSVCETPLLRLIHASWITVKGIHFQMGAGQGLSIENSHHINILNCEIHGCAGDGIIIKKGHANTIASCQINYMGRGAVKVSGGNRKTLEKAGFLIDNCHIHHLSRIDHTYTPGIWVDGVGTHIRHCKLHDIPSSAMRINGNDHLVEYNEMYHVVTESDDQGAIDMWGDPTYRGNVFRYNYIYDVGPSNQDEINAHCGRAGIRFDDAISGNLVYSNVFKNCAGGHFGAIQIHGGKENLIWNNLFYQCNSGISFTAWRLDFWEKYNRKSLDFLEENRFLYITRYPELVRVNEEMNRNSVIQNIFMNCEQTLLRRPEALIFQDNLETNLPLGKGDLGRAIEAVNTSPEMRKQIIFEPIPFERMGLRK